MKHSCKHYKAKSALLQVWMQPQIKADVFMAAEWEGLSASAWVTMILKREAAKTGRRHTKATGRPAAGNRHNGSNRRGRGCP